MHTLGALVQGFGYIGPFIATAGNKTGGPAGSGGAPLDGPGDQVCWEAVEDPWPRVATPHTGVKSDICPVHLSTSPGDSVRDGDKNAALVRM